MSSTVLVIFFATIIFASVSEYEARNLPNDVFADEVDCTINDRSGHVPGVCVLKYGRNGGLGVPFCRALDGNLTELSCECIKHFRRKLQHFNDSIYRGYCTAENFVKINQEQSIECFVGKDGSYKVQKCERSIASINKQNNMCLTIRAEEGTTFGKLLN
ncbi:unnamed protein product [Enterobius vermicularis]|uniref:Secreted protein n=1 Tax=Enterobius vermicularis TaxID=51028 RepID=A0A0N4VCQ4_ENTVE|nr:unnamed protein product [Enterobius vermicularis]